MLRMTNRFCLDSCESARIGTKHGYWPSENQGQLKIGLTRHPGTYLRPKVSVYGIVLGKCGFVPVDGLVPLDGVARQVLEHPVRGSGAAVVRHHKISANSTKRDT